MNPDSLPEAVHLSITALGQSIGVQALALDAEGCLALGIGEGLAVELVSQPEQSCLLLFGAGGLLPPGCGPAPLKALLQANFGWQSTGGATISLDAEDPPHVLLALRLPWHTLSQEALLEAFETLRSRLPGLQTWLREQALAPASCTGEAAAVGAASPPWHDLA